LIQVSHLTKKYNSHTAVDDISFNIGKNEIVGFLGPNGAGKSTTLKVLTCFHSATSGSVKIGGFDIFENPVAVKSLIGYLPENVPLYPEMRVHEYLAYRSGIKGVSSKHRTAAINSALERCRLHNVKNKIIGQLSKGYRQRVGLADALLANPPILILDEPTVGLDPGQIRDIRELIKELGKERTVILSSHILPEVEAVCSRIIIINNGKIAGSGTTGELKKQIKAEKTVELEIIDPGNRCISSLSTIGNISEIDKGNNTESDIRHLTVMCSSDSTQTLREQIFDSACTGQFKIISMIEKNRSLEDIFVDIITSGQNPPDIKPVISEPGETLQ
jgi:ABC-2 type transport system ATP-binding protein